MHFSIPDTQEIYTDATSTYTGYNIYINGTFHCCLRFKQLHALHEQLRRHCTEINVQLPPFPPKRLLPLTTSQLEARRSSIEEYLQYLGQDARIAKLDFLQNFLLNAQFETAERLYAERNDEEIRRNLTVTLDVVLMNGQKIKLENVHISSNSNALLRQACDFLRLPKHLMPYFCLFLAKNDIGKDNRVLLQLLRRLMDFESPYLSKCQAQPCQILLRKCYWDPAFDLHLLKDKTAQNMLFIQTVGDVDNDWIITTPDVRQKLRNFQEHNLKKEYIEMARQLPLYGCLQFDESTVDYPERNTIALISIGNKELSMRTIKGPKIYETKFRVTRMRCWRVTAIHNSQTDAQNGTNESLPNIPVVPTNLQLSFEYLMSKKLRWITISSSQAMLMSVCLQSMVDELLSLRSNSNQSDSIATDYASISQSRSGTLLSSSSSTPSFSNEPLSSTSTSTTSSTSSSSSPTAPVRFIAQQQRRTKNNPKIMTAASYAAVFFRNAQDESVRNEAFEGIGDDDL